MFQLVALDVDGTLFNSLHELPGGNKIALTQLVEKGIHICLSTGKSFRTVQNLVQELNLKSPQITSDGASIVDPTTKIPLFRYALSKDLVIEVVELLDELRATTIVVSEDTSFATAINDDVMYMCGYGDPTPSLVRDLVTCAEIEPTHLMVVAYQKDHLYDHVFRTLNSTFGNRLNIVKSSPYFLEILNPLASKGNALRTVLEYLGINKKDAICIGDGLNDISMFQNVGVAVAMGNSDEEVKNAASFVTETNDNLGVAKALDKFFDNLFQ